MAKGKIFPEPAGPSKRYWNNEGGGTRGPVLCEICGTEHPEDDSEGYTFMSFLGLQGIEQCCGRAADVLYLEFGEQFAIAFLEDFAENPTDPRFTIFLMAMESAFRKAKEKSDKVSSELKKFQSSLGGKTALGSLRL